MVKKTLIAVATLATLAILMSFQWPAKLQKKIDKTVLKTYEIPAADYVPVEITEGEDQVTNSKINGHLFKVMSEEVMKGYVYVQQAPSMKDVFDYAVLFDADLNVINAKVLIYREQHGRQIGARRWLKQFFGMTTADTPELGVNVDGISGATISVTSMTNAMADVLSSLRYLQSVGKI